MKWHHPSAIGLCLLLIFGEMSGSASACSGLDRKYSYLLDLVFPTEWEMCSPPGLHTLFSTEKMIIRILPGLSLESQILVCRDEDGKTFVVHSTLAPKNHSVYSHLSFNKKLSDGSYESLPSKEPVETIAKLIQADHKACKMDSSLVDTWFQETRKRADGVAKSEWRQ